MIKNFSIDVKLEERWIPYFCSFLKKLEDNSNAGHSSIIGFYADGDGDFRAKFKPRVDYDLKDPYLTSKVCEKIYDAG